MLTSPVFSRPPRALFLRPNFHPSFKEPALVRGRRPHCFSAGDASPTTALAQTKRLQRPSAFHSLLLSLSLSPRFSLSGDPNRSFFYLSLYKACARPPSFLATMKVSLRRRVPVECDELRGGSSTGKKKKKENGKEVELSLSRKTKK